jgi:hypothetical protein
LFRILFCPNNFFLQALLLAESFLLPQIKPLLRLKICFFISLILVIIPNQSTGQDGGEESDSFRNFSEGPVSFKIPGNSSVDILKSYFELKGQSNAQYIITSISKFGINPSIAIGLNDSGENIITSESNSPHISIIIQPNTEHSDLNSWASTQQRNWTNSPTGELFSAEKFVTKSGFNGISIVRENGSERDFYISLDLTTKEWSNKNLEITNNPEIWLQAQIFGFKDPTKDGVYSNALMIAKSIIFNPEKLALIPSLKEIKTDYPQANNNPVRIISDGPISYNIPSNMKIEFKDIYFEIGKVTKVQHNLEIKSEDSFTTLIAHSESHYPDLETWAIHQSSTWEKSEKGQLFLVENFKNNYGFNGISVVRQVGTTFDFFITVDLTTSEWSDRYSKSTNGNDSAWLKVQIVGFYDPIHEGVFPTAMEMAKSLNFENDQINSQGNDFKIQEISIPLFPENNQTISDGPITFSIPDDTAVDFIKTFVGQNINPKGLYNLSNKSSNSFITLSAYTEKIYPDLNTWAVHTKNTLERNSESILVSSGKFITQNGFPCIFIKRETPNSQDCYISLDITTEKWRGKFPQSIDTWLRAEIKTTNNSLNNTLHETAQNIANSLQYNEAGNHPLPKFLEISSDTLFRSPEIIPFWFKSDWFDVFYQDQNKWIYHELMGWLYPIEMTLESGWFWHEAFDWIWTSNKTFPYFYSPEYSAWLYFYENFKDQKIFFNSKSKQWEKTDILQKIMRDYAGNETQTIIKIMKSSLSENEKLNGVGRVILYGN